MTLRGPAFQKRSIYDKTRTFRSEMNLGLFCSEFLSVHGTHCSQIDNLELFCSEFLFLSGTYCFQIAHLWTNLGLFRSKFLSLKKYFVPKLNCPFKWKQTIRRAKIYLGKFNTILVACHSYELCTIVMRAGKEEHILASSNTNEVPSVVIGSFLANM